MFDLAYFKEIITSHLRKEKADYSPKNKLKQTLP